MGKVMENQSSPVFMGFTPKSNLDLLEIFMLGISSSKIYKIRNYYDYCCSPLEAFFISVFLEAVCYP